MTTALLISLVFTFIVLGWVITVASSKAFLEGIDEPLRLLVCSCLSAFTTIAFAGISALALAAILSEMPL
jgi:hypothetical protein